MGAETGKRAVGYAAATLVRSGMRVGLGTGSTAAYLVQALGEAWQRGELHDLRLVPTSIQTAQQAQGLGLPLCDLDEVGTLDLTIDGADEVDPGLALIKGRGGALLREKIVAAASLRMVVITDDSKLVSALGSTMPVPVEVEPFGYKTTWRLLEALGCTAQLRLGAAGRPFHTDGRHLILDCSFGPIADPAALQAAICQIPGAIECGLFVGMARQALIGRGDSVWTLAPGVALAPWQPEVPTQA